MIKARTCQPLRSSKIVYLLLNQSHLLVQGLYAQLDISIKIILNVQSIDYFFSQLVDSLSHLHNLGESNSDSSICGGRDSNHSCGDSKVSLLPIFYDPALVAIFADTPDTPWCPLGWALTGLGQHAFRHSHLSKLCSSCLLAPEALALGPNCCMEQSRTQGSRLAAPVLEPLKGSTLTTF